MTAAARRPDPGAEYQARVDRLIAECDDEDLALLKPMALARVTDARERARLGGWSVRGNNWLRALVYEALTEGIPLMDILRADATSKRNAEAKASLFK